MRRLCERPGCAAPAEVSYGIDNSNLTVWLDNSHVPEREHAGRLCRRHANALVVPRGWTVDDRRQPIPQLFRNLDRAGIEAERTERKSKPRPKKKAGYAPTSGNEERNDSTSDEPTLFSEVGNVHTNQEVVSETKKIVADPDETQAIAWSPATVAAGGDGEPDDEPVFGRLMGRAFRQKGAQ